MLVEDVLNTLSRPYGEDITDDVFYEIFSVGNFSGEYDYLCRVLGKPVVNSWGARWIGIILQEKGLEPAHPATNILIKTYKKFPI